MCSGMATQADCRYITGVASGDSFKKLSFERRISRPVHHSGYKRQGNVIDLLFQAGSQAAPLLFSYKALSLCLNSRNQSIEGISECLNTIVLYLLA